MLRQTRRKENTVSRTRTFAASACAGLIGTGLLVAAPAQAVKSAPDNALHALTLNLYLGGSLGDAINAASNIVEFLPAAAIAETTKKGERLARLVA